jgi:hypothetical protein
MHGPRIVLIWRDGITGLIRICSGLFHGRNRNGWWMLSENPGTGYGAGLMQIDSQHHARLSEFGIKPEHLLTDACLYLYRCVLSGAGV